MRRMIPVLLLPLVLVLAACAQPAAPGGSSESPGARTDYAPDEVVLRVEYRGGFVPVQHIATRLPAFTVYGDGRVITEGPVIAIYPSPALPNVLVRLIGAPAMNQLVTLAVEAGVGESADYGTPTVADAPSTRFVVSAQDGVRETEVEALDFDEGLTSEQVAARQRLRDLWSRLTDLPATLGADAAGEELPYEPEALAAVTSPWVDPGDESLPPPQEQAWPGPALPGQALGIGDLTCVDVTGADVAAVLEAARTANALTPWVWEGERYSVAFRPLLPDEASCHDLTD